MDAVIIKIFTNPVLLMILLLLANGFFVAVEFALVTVRRSRLHELVDQEVRAAKIAQSLQKNMDFSIAGAQLGITLASLALGWVADEAVHSLFAGILGKNHIPLEVGMVISFIFLSMSHVILGEQVPKSWALRSAEQMLLILAVPFRAFCIVAFPLITIMNVLSQAVLRVLKIPLASETAHAIGSPEEFKILFEQSEQAGALDESERLLLTRTLGLRNMHVANFMVHMSDVDWLNLEEPLSDLLEQIRDTRHRRLPVATRDLDNVLGYIDAKEILAEISTGRKLQLEDLRNLAHEVTFVPETKHALSVLRDFQHAHIDMAMVMDEYGSVRGIITTHNLLEAAVGRLPEDLESDEEPKVVSPRNGVWIVSGTLPLEELHQIIGEFESPESRSRFYTLAGLLITLLDRIPDEGDVIEFHGYRFRVVQMENYRVTRVRITKLDRATTPPAASSQHQPSHPKVA